MQIQNHALVLYSKQGYEDISSLWNAETKLPQGTT